MNILPVSRLPRLLLACVVLGAVPATGPLTAQTASPSGLWHDADEETLLAAHGGLTAAAARRGVVPSAYRTLHLDRALLGRLLAAAPREFAGSAAAALEIELPVPQSADYVKFRVEESPVMQDALAARYPEIRTYVAHGVGNPALFARLDLTPAGFHAMILSPGGQVYIDPYFADGSDAATAIAYYKRDYFADRPFRCAVRRIAHRAAQAVPADATPARPPAGTALRTYRLALAATAEYTAAVGGGSVSGDGSFLSAGTVPAALAAMVTSVNRVDGVYEREFAIRLVLVSHTDQLIYTSPQGEPYTNADGDAMLAQNQGNVDKVIGDANYDLGHVFSTAGGGIADVGCVCYSGYKAQGVTGLASPKGDAFDIDYVAHEMGHQFGAEHSFNSTVGSCGGGRRVDSAAYEPGSGSTIMCYAGLCSDGGSVQDLQAHSDDYFHTVSYDEINAYTTTSEGQNAFATTATGNTPPTVATPTAYTIPISTPFALTAVATDADADSLTYCWEEFDLGLAVNATTPAGLDDGSSPLFRSYAPTASPTRVFPALTYLLNNANVPPLIDGAGFLSGEVLPSAARPGGLNFRCTVRDNHAGGGASTYAAVQLTVATGAGPFAVTAPNTLVTYTGGSTQNVTWNVANTTAAPVSCADVKISLSVDGGQTFPYVLARSTPNNGSASVVIPNPAASSPQARIKVEAVGNIFFDVSDVNFVLTARSELPQAPTITTPPASVSVGIGGSATFTVAVGGAPPFTYQWYKNGSAIAGATGASYPVVGALAGSAGSYAAEVSNADGTVASTAAVLSVNTTAHPNFFSGEAALSDGVYYLAFGDGVPFGYYSYASFPYLYHFDIGFAYFDAADDMAGGAYLYDFTSGSWWYTAPGLFPYLYDFTLNAWLYYYPNANDNTHYTKDPRYFYDFGTRAIITR